MGGSPTDLLTARQPYVISEVRLPDSVGHVDIFVDDGCISDIAPTGKRRDERRIQYSGGGNLVLPRFIDVHSHADARVWNPELSHVKSLQGIGHEIVGNCGLGPAPSLGTSDGWRAILSGVGIAGPPGWQFQTLNDYWAHRPGEWSLMAPTLYT